MLRIPAPALAQMAAHAYDCYPEEMCGLIAGPAAGEDVAHFYPCTNAAASAMVYDLDSRDYMRADREAEDHGWEILGVVHSHTHTEPYPSPTDVVQAPDPGWHYVIVSLKRDAPETRSYRIVDGVITEEPVAIL
jgi:[CysO sulfur-carrier protein]-S-L-cysteine hydrolase